MLLNELGNYLSQIRIGGPSRSQVISELCSPLQERRFSFLEGRNLECLIAIHTCELHLNFLSFEVFEGQKSEDYSRLHLALFRLCASQK
jgi:hypothetical protein